MTPRQALALLPHYGLWLWLMLLAGVGMPVYRIAARFNDWPSPDALKYVGTGLMALFLTLWCIDVLLLLRRRTAEDRELT